MLRRLSSWQKAFVKLHISITEIIFRYKVPASSVVVQSATIVNQSESNSPTNTPSTVIVSKKKKKKKGKEKKQRPKPGEIRLTTALGIFFLLNFTQFMAQIALKSVSIIHTLIILNYLPYWNFVQHSVKLHLTFQLQMAARCIVAQSVTWHILREDCWSSILSDILWKEGTNSLADCSLMYDVLNISLLNK